MTSADNRSYQTVIHTQFSTFNFMVSLPSILVQSFRKHCFCWLFSRIMKVAVMMGLIIFKLQFLADPLKVFFTKPKVTREQQRLAYPYSPIQTRNQNINHYKPRKKKWTEQFCPRKIASVHVTKARKRLRVIKVKRMPRKHRR